MSDDLIYVTRCPLPAGHADGVHERIRELEARITQLEAVLRAIAERREPCQTCGKVHVYREDPALPAKGSLKAGMTWADPDDGHVYERLTPESIARRALVAQEEQG